MGAGREKVFHEITLIPADLRFTGSHPDDTPTAASLGTKFAFRCPFNVAAVGNGNDASLVGDQILIGNISLSREDRGKPFGTVLIPDPKQFLLDDRHHPIGAMENVEEIVNLPDDFAVFVDNLFTFKSGELVKAQIENLIRLVFAEDISTIY
jgi:hypothetical protein